MPGVNYISAVKAGDPRIFAISSDSHSVIMSKDDGATWSKVVTIEDVPGWSYPGIQYGLDVDYENDIVYFANYGYLKRYDMKTGTLTDLEANMREVAPDRWTWGFAVDPNHPEILYCGMHGGAAVQFETSYKGGIVIRSFDRGETWQRFETNTSDENSIVKTGPTIVGQNVANLFVDPKDGYVYIFGGDTGIYKFPPPYEMD